MKVLITCPRAPVAIEWAQIVRKSGHAVTFVDSLKNPLGRYLPEVRYVQVPSPRFEYTTYKKEILKLISEHDVTIPTCEDIFYLTKAVKGTGLEEKVFTPSFETLIGLHNKYSVQKQLNDFVKFPKTRFITNINSIDYNDQNSILKPVFSRFGTNVVRSISKDVTAHLDISEKNPWIQQEKIEGEYLCNYAVIDKGVVIDHVVYTPRYLANNAAATFFEYIQNSRCEEFIKKFATDHQFTGQVAFDFIENKDGLFVIECNPRSTSGLHLISNRISISEDGFVSNYTQPFKSCRVGKSIIFMFGPQSLARGTFMSLIRDYKKSRDVLRNVSTKAQILAFAELLRVKREKNITFAEATAYDIEYNNDQET